MCVCVVCVTVTMNVASVVKSVAGKIIDSSQIHKHMPVNVNVFFENVGSCGQLRP